MKVLAAELEAKIWDAIERACLGDEALRKAWNESQREIRNSRVAPKPPLVTTGARRRERVTAGG